MHLAVGETKPAGAAGPLELQFALRAIDISKGKETSTCQQIIPHSTPRGAVTIYDSALPHRGEANVGSRSRVILNVNVASGEGAIEEENYQAYFKGKVAHDDV